MIWRIWRILKGVLDLQSQVHLSLIAAGVAFFSMFSLFPGLAALIAIFGLVADPGVVEEQLVLLDGLVPEDALALLAGQIDRLLNARSETLGLATIVSISLALWAARGGVGAVMQGLNAITRKPARSGVRHYVVALSLTLSMVGIGLTALMMVVVAPVILAFVPVTPFTALLIDAGRWITAFVIVMLALGILYRYGPNRRGARMGWITPGALMAVVLWVTASFGFSLYLQNFGSYNEVYGSIGAVVALLMWLYISAFLVMLGAVLNVVLEEQGVGVRLKAHPTDGG